MLVDQHYSMKARLGAVQMTTPKRLIVFVSDNHARDAVGCYGHPIVKTPAIDSIARRGTRFSAACSASPLCVPARAAMATGRFPNQTGYWDNAIAYDSRITSWMRRLRDQGHHVTSIGKLHYRSSDEDHGMTEEILPMHLHGKGAVTGLLRGFDAEKPKKPGVITDLYEGLAGEGETHYQEYDRQITERAIAWLRDHREQSDRPDVLIVSYISPHPPFRVPKHLLDLYPEAEMPLPLGFDPAPEHPAVAHVRWLDGMPEHHDHALLRRVASGYFGLVTHTDEQVGLVLQEMDSLGVLEESCIAYTSDHGDMLGSQGIYGKRVLYEGSLGVPLIMAGPGIRSGHVSHQLASHVDLYPTFLEAVGGRIEEEDRDLPGVSLWPALSGRDDLDRPLFAELHSQGTKAGAFVIRQRDEKLIYHVGMPPQIFDLAADPHELCDLAETNQGAAIFSRLMPLLREMCEPEVVNDRAKADQRATAESYGGPEAVGRAEYIVFTPPPGVSTEQAWSGIRSNT
jgi:choline-sulfatase